MYLNKVLLLLLLLLTNRLFIGLTRCGIVIINIITLLVALLVVVDDIPSF